MIPVFRICQRPGKLDPDGVILPAFGHIISRKEEYCTQKQFCGEQHIKIHMESIGINLDAANERNSGTD